MGPNSAWGASPDCRSRSSCRIASAALPDNAASITSQAVFAPSPAYLPHQLLADLATRPGIQHQLGEFLIQETELGADHFQQHGGCVLCQLCIVTRLGPVDEPRDDPRLIDDLLPPTFHQRSPTLHLQPVFVDQFVQAGVGGPFRDVQHQHAPFLGTFHVLFKPAAVVLHETIGVLHNRQSQSRSG